MFCLEQYIVVIIAFYFLSVCLFFYHAFTFVFMYSLVFSYEGILSIVSNISYNYSFPYKMYRTDTFFSLFT